MDRRRVRLGATTKTTLSAAARCTYQAHANGTYRYHLADVATDEADNIGVALLLRWSTQPRHISRRRVCGLPQQQHFQAA